MSMTKQKRVLAFTLVLANIVGLGLMSGCKWWPFADKSKEETAVTGSSSSVMNSDDVLLSLDGKPALTVADYEEQLDMARKMNPQIDMFLQMIPNAEKEFFKGIVVGKLLKAWAEKEGVNNTADFQKQKKAAHESIDLQLYLKALEDAYPIHVTDSELKKYYEEKKDVIPGLMLSQAGVSVSYIRFDSKDKADKFLTKVKEAKSLKKFKTDAEAEKLSVAEAVINEKSSFSDTLKTAVLGVKIYPHVLVVKVGDNAYWVLFVSGKSEVKYRDFSSPEVEQGLRKMLEDERKAKQLEELLEKWKKEFNVQENQEFFNKKEEQKRTAMESLAKEHEKNTNGDSEEEKGSTAEKL
ncbi:peptidyl-prolyl cis-trans isomerase [Candidatus Dependentiae bacterium]|nr:peptidyl-prolyl cis-trans isomerase [Candidatus Dependentiae bacterium]